MPVSKFSVPFLNNERIRKKADRFGEKFWGDKVPVDIERIIDLKLEIAIDLKIGLQKECGTDALISSNWKLIYVDRDSYLNKNQNRLRFSFAHEIGHFILHKDIYHSFKIKTIDDFYRLIGKISSDQYGYLEAQANKFANYLLVPRNILIGEREKELEKIKNQKLLKKADIKTINSYLAVPISKVFGVSELVVEFALNEVSATNNTDLLSKF